MPRKRSAGEALFLHWFGLLAVDYPMPTEEVMFANKTAFKRQWRFDFVWNDEGQKVAVEVDGGAWLSKVGGKGRHTTGVGFEGDCDKLNAAVVLGWRVLRYTPSMIKRDPVGCIELVKLVLDGNESKPAPPTFKRGKPGTLIDDDLLIDLDEESEAE